MQSDEIEGDTTTLWFLEVGEPGKLDTLLFKARTDDPLGKDNKGLYGVDSTFVLNYTVPGERYGDLGFTRCNRGPIEPKNVAVHGAAPRMHPTPLNLKVPPIWRIPPTGPGTGSTRLVRLRKNQAVRQAASLEQRLAIGGESLLPGAFLIAFSPEPWPVNQPA